MKNFICFLLLLIFTSQAFKEKEEVEKKLANIAEFFKLSKCNKHIILHIFYSLLVLNNLTLRKILKKRQKY